MSQVAPAYRRIPVWDPLIRIFHWALAACFGLAWYYKGEASIHETAGIMVLVLLAVRLIWGVIGFASARFETFVTGPFKTLGYLASIFGGRPRHHAGHNPAGAAMIVALIICLFTLSATGLLMKTTRLWGNAAIEWVHGQAATVALWLIGAHVVGVLLASLQHREFLPLSMVTGRKRLPAATTRYLGPLRFTGFRVYLATSAVLLLGGGLWLAHLVLDSGIWRIPRRIAATEQELGCQPLSISATRIEVFPAFALVFDVQAQDGQSSQLAIRGPDVLSRKPPFDQEKISSICKPRLVTNTGFH